MDIDNRSANQISPKAGPAATVPARLGPGAWLVLYATGACLLILLLVHLGLVHLASNEPFTLRRSAAALSSSPVAAVELALLLLGLIHSLSGLRRVILDLEVLGRTGDRVLSWGLAGAGACLFVWGIMIFNRLAVGQG